MCEGEGGVGVRVKEGGVCVRGVCEGEGGVCEGEGGRCVCEGEGGRCVWVKEGGVCEGCV